MSTSLPSCQHWRSKRDSDDILWLFLDRQGESVNSLSSAVLQEFDNLITYATQHLPRGVAILSGKASGFILGADIREFGNFTDPVEVTRAISQVHDMFSRLERLPCPTVAAFDG